jgi:RimJ/RimL family protein N-acetyltransferase
MTPEALTLTGSHIRLEPLDHRHIEALVAASAAPSPTDPTLNTPSFYQWSPVPQDIPAATRYVETAIRWRNEGTAVPFAVIRISDNTVIGSTRFWNLEYWAWPSDHPRHNNQYPDTCEIGYTWYARSAVRTAANTQAKLLMLTHAFEVWNVLSVCLHTDVRNLRSQAAMERIGCKREGILRAHRIAADLTPRDSARYSILAAEWPDVKQRLETRRLSPR